MGASGETLGLQISCVLWRLEEDRARPKSVDLCQGTWRWQRRPADLQLKLLKNEQEVGGTASLQSQLNGSRDIGCKTVEGMQERETGEGFPIDMICSRLSLKLREKN